MADNEALFTPELVFFDWECATPDEVFARLEGELAPHGYIASGWLDAVRTREDAYPTGLAMPAANIAIPHTDPGFVAKPYIAVVKPAAPVTFNAMAGMGAPVPAQIVINLGIAEPGGQVEALQALMNIFMGADAAADVLGQTTPQGSQCFYVLLISSLPAVRDSSQVSAHKERPTAKCHICPLCTKMVQINLSPMHQACRGGCVVTQWRLFDSLCERPTMANKKKNSEAAPTPEQQARAASSSRKKQRKTYVSKTVKIVLVVIGVLAMLLSVSAMACSGLMSQAEDTSGYKLTGGVAATINGTNLTEDTVTKQIMSMRTSYGYTKDEDWAQYLVDNDLTPKKYRKQLIDSYTQQILLQQAQKENGVTVSDEEVEKAWKDACKSAGGAKAFKKTLKTYGYTEDTYKDSLKESLAQQKLKDAVAPTSKPKDSEIVDYINESLSSYNDARRSSNILIKVDSDASDEDKAAAKAKAQECLDKINSGELSFEDAVEQYSEDTGSKEKKGDVGWDKLTTFVDSYQTALEGLNKGDVSEVVESTYGYHIIKCTDYFHVDNQVDDINQVPKDIKKYVSNVVKTQAASTAYSEWLEQYKKDADITVNPMPKDVPYNVSLKGVTKSSTDDSSTTE